MLFWGFGGGGQVGTVSPQNFGAESKWRTCQHSHPELCYTGTWAHFSEGWDRMCQSNEMNRRQLSRKHNPAITQRNLAWHSDMTGCKWASLSWTFPPWGRSARKTGHPQTRPCPGLGCWGSVRVGKQQPLLASSPAWLSKWNEWHHWGWQHPEPPLWFPLAPPWVEIHLLHACAGALGPSETNSPEKTMVELHSAVPTLTSHPGHLQGNGVGPGGEKGL